MSDAGTAAEGDIHRRVAGATIAQLRDKHGWTQAQLAEKLGVAQATVSRVEHGLVEADMAQVRALAAAFSMKPAELMELIDEGVEKAKIQAGVAGGGATGDGWKKVVAVMGAVGVAGLAGFAAALALKERGAKKEDGKSEEADKSAAKKRPR